MKIAKHALAALGLIALLGPSAVRADDFSFSFTSVNGTEVVGTVTGEVLGLSNNSTSAATDVILTSYPTGLDLPAAPLEVITGFTVINNSFTETNGQVTSADFESRSGSRTSFVLFCLAGDVTCDGENLLNNSGNFLEGSPSFSAITFTPLAATVPEPSSLVLLGTGFLGLMRMRRKRLA